MKNSKLIKERLSSCVAITWDECHKMYILMDDNQVKQCESYGYNTFAYAKENTTFGLYRIILSWYNQACELRMLDAVTTLEDGEEEYERLIEQF